MDTPLLIRIEIIFLLVLLLYIFYYIGYLILRSSRKLRMIFGIGASKKLEKDSRYRVKVEKSDDSSVKEHGKNKRKLSNTEKNQIIELVKRVKVNISKREFDIAKNQIIEGLTIDKFNTDLNLELASIYIEEDEFIKAEYIYKDLILVHAENIEILKKLGYVLSIQEKYDMAIEMYKKAHKLEKGDEEVLNMLGQITYYIGDYLGAIKYSKKMLKIKPKNVDNLQILAGSYEKTQSLDLALEVYKELSHIQPYDTNIRNKIKELKQK